jgi:hypothetical protein
MSLGSYRRWFCIIRDETNDDVATISGLVRTFVRTGVEFYYFASKLGSGRLDAEFGECTRKKFALPLLNAYERRNSKGSSRIVIEARA